MKRETKSSPEEFRSTPALKALQDREKSLRDNLIPFCEKGGGNVQARQRLPEYKKELEGLSEILKWISDFRDHVEDEQDPVQTAKFLNDMGIIDDPEECFCGEEELQDNESVVLQYLHSNHTTLNLAIHEILATKQGLLEKIRAAFEKDIQSPGSYLPEGEDSKFKPVEDTNDLPEGTQIFGAFIEADKKFSRKLIDNFLTKEPNKEWCRIKTTRRKNEDEE